MEVSMAQLLRRFSAQSQAQRTSLRDSTTN
jgi:hypothetical protein